MKTSRLLMVSLLAVTLGAGGIVAAKGGAKPPPPPKPACGMTFLPLVEGNFWTYKLQTGKNEVTIKVVAVHESAEKDPAKAVTTIDIEETTATGPVKSTWTCNAEGLQIDPHSFLYSGEPGPLYGMSDTLKDRKGISLAPDEAFVKDSGWSDELNLEVARADTAGHGALFLAAKLNLKKNVIVRLLLDPIESPFTKSQIAALKVTYDLRGEVTMEGLEKPSVLPVKRVVENAPGMWFVKGLGIVKIQDSFDKDWDLIATNLAVPN